MTDNPDEPESPKPAKRRRVAAVYENGTSFAQIRQAVMERHGNVDIIGSRLETHVESCEGFRKLVLACVVGAASLIFGVIGVLYNNQSNSDTREAAAIAELSGRIAEVRARQDVVLSRLAVVDQTFADLRKDVTDRLAGIVAANGRREETFGDRFVQLDQAIKDIAKEFYAHRLRENNSDDYQPSSGPTKRR